MSKIGEITSPNGEKIRYEILDTVEIECDYGKRLKYKKGIKKIRYLDDGDIAYIFGYYYWHPERKYWHWTQRPLIASSDEIQKLLKIAKEKGFFT